MTHNTQPKPVGQRPRCLQCDRPLRPNFRRESPPLSVKTGETVSVQKAESYGKPQPEYEDLPLTRTLTPAERKQWLKEHPPEFLGTYGSFRDSRFCGLNCGYDWAIAHTRPQV